MKKFFDVENKAFWIVLGILFVILIAGLIFGLVMTAKYGAPDDGTSSQPKEEIKVGVQPNNAFLDFCNNDRYYAFDANYVSNPPTSVDVVSNGASKSITDANEIKALWDNVKQVRIGEAVTDAVTEPAYTLTFHRAEGNDVVITFETDKILTINNANYAITEPAGLFEKL